MKRIISILCVVVLALSVVPAVSQQAPAPDPNTPKVTPPPSVEVTPKQPYDATTAELVIANEEALKAQSDKVDLQAQLQAEKARQPIIANYAVAESNMQAWIASVKKVNGWGEDVNFDRATRKFMRVVKAAPAPAEAPKK